MPATGFVTEDVRIVRSLLSKHVVAATYEDAMRRGIIGKAAAVEEMRAILHSYDEGIARMIAGNGNGNGNGNGDTK